MAEVEAYWESRVMRVADFGILLTHRVVLLPKRTERADSTPIYLACEKGKAPREQMTKWLDIYTCSITAPVTCLACIAEGDTAHDT